MLSVYIVIVFLPLCSLRPVSLTDKKVRISTTHRITITPVEEAQKDVTYEGIKVAQNDRTLEMISPTEKLEEQKEDMDADQEEDHIYTQTEVAHKRYHTGVDFTDSRGKDIQSKPPATHHSEEAIEEPELYPQLSGSKPDIDKSDALTVTRIQPEDLDTKIFMKKYRKVIKQRRYRPTIDLTASYKSRSKSHHSSRQKRSNINNTSKLSGDVVFSARPLCRLFFGFDYTKLPQRKFKALLHLFKKSATKNKKNRKEKVRVSVYQLLVPSPNNHSTMKLLDTKLVKAGKKGWVKFDVTRAVEQWRRTEDSNVGLEVWIESAQNSQRSVKLASRTQFVTLTSKNVNRQPELVISFN